MQKKKIKLEECLIIIAHPGELNENIKALGDNLLVTGVGKVNAAYQLTKKLTGLRMKNKLPKYVINMGSAGSKKYKKGELVYCNKFIQHDMDCTAFGYEKGVTPSDEFSLILEHEKLINDLPVDICGSGDCFVTTQVLDTQIGVVEMEAYALARICKLENIDFISIKFITDGLDETGHEDWKNEVKSSSEVMYEYLKKLLDL